MLPTDVVGVIAVGVDGRVVRSAKASVPFLATLTGQGVESGVINPVTVRVHVEVSMPQPGAVTLSRMLKVPGLVGMPEISPVLVFIDKPWGRKSAEMVPGWFGTRRPGERGSGGYRTRSLTRLVKLWTGNVRRERRQHNFALFHEDTSEPVFEQAG